MKLESDARSNSYRRKEVECDITMYTDHELNSQITIKTEPHSSESTTAEMKLELEEPSVSNAHSKNGFMFVSLGSVTEFKNDGYDVKMGNRNVKKEPYWENTVSDMINTSEGSHVSNADMQEVNKDITSDVNKRLQESLTEASRSQSERVCSFDTSMSTFSTSADVERNICLEMKEGNGETEFVLEPKTHSAVHDSHTHEIKAVPLYLDGTSTKIKLEIEEPFVTNTHLMKQLGPVPSENKAVICKADDNAVHMKIEIKEETWLDTSSEIPLRSNVSLGIDTDLQSYEKNCTSDREEKYQELLCAQKPRLHTESVCPSVSTFSINGDCLKLKEHNPGGEETGMYTFHRYNITEEYRKENPAEILGSEFPQSKDNYESDYDFTLQKESNISIYSGENVDSSRISNHKTPEILGLKTDEKKRYKCNICNKSFNRAGHLKEHNLFHEGKKLHKCETCTKSFTRTSDLKKHTLIHKGERVQCKICGKDFSRAAYLKTHTVIHEGKMPHRCNICEKSFTTSFTLKRHSLVHEGKRLYLCKICDKSFTTTSYLKKHSLSHKGLSSHKCKICEKSFMWASGLKKHNRIHEGKGVNLEEKALLVQHKNNPS